MAQGASWPSGPVYLSPYLSFFPPPLLYLSLFILTSRHRLASITSQYHLLSSLINYPWCKGIKWAGLVAWAGTGPFCGEGLAESGVGVVGVPPRPRPRPRPLPRPVHDEELGTRVHYKSWAVLLKGPLQNTSLSLYIWKLKLPQLQQTEKKIISCILWIMVEYIHDYLLHLPFTRVLKGGTWVRYKTIKQFTSAPLSKVLEEQTRSVKRLS